MATARTPVGWSAEVLIPLKLQGILEVTETALVVRFKFTARPVKPGWIQREYLKRIYLVFAEKGIAFASGALTLKTAPAVSATGDGAVLAERELAYSLAEMVMATPPYRPARTD